MACAFGVLLFRPRDHLGVLRIKNDDHHHHEDVHHGEDHNLKGAYLHVLADALTSVLAIVALGVGYVLNWWVFDPLIGVLGGVIIVRWSEDIGEFWYTACPCMLFAI